MSFDLVDLVIKVSAFVLSVAAMIVAWFGGRHKDIETRFAAHGQRVDEIDRRTQRIEQVVATLPGRDDLHGLEIAMTQISGQLSVIGEAMNGQREIMKRLESIVSRHEDHLLEGKR